MKFEIKEDFLLDGQPFKILSGAIHYFRIHPSDWYHSLYNLKALGFNTVETYVPWNLHEPEEGKFDFTGICDLPKFIKLAAELELFVILRPSPYICAEWEFGGLPGWLLEKDCRIRSSDLEYLKHVTAYYEHLIPLVTPLQISQGGPILMMQVENEYGSYGEDKEYLEAVAQLMEDQGVDVPLVTSDGSWEATLQAGSMIEKNILPTGNFGSKGIENFRALKKFHESYGKKWPLMCMEFWDGWFNRWGEPIVTRETGELIDSLREVLTLGSVNLYMFHGGTNFGFMNGCSARGTVDLPQITSYDYGAPLNEQGNPTEKYYAIKDLIHEMFPDLEQTEPLIKECLLPRSLELIEKVSLFSVVDDISEVCHSKYPLSMEAVGQYHGYQLYRTQLRRDAPAERYRIIDGRDRAQVYLNGQHIVTQYQEEIGDDIHVEAPYEENQLAILMENMGRVNYGHKLLADTQRKGIRQGVMTDLHFILGWSQAKICFDRLGELDFSKAWGEGQPSFYRYELMLEGPVQDTYLDLSGFGKGICVVNGENMGRFWEKGPVHTLYVASGFLRSGKNEIIIFETEGKYSEQLCLASVPNIDISSENN